MTNVTIECRCGAATKIPVANLLAIRRLPKEMDDWAEAHRASGCLLMDHPPAKAV
jgi:hypothetical protein